MGRSCGQGWQNGTPQFLPRSTVRWYGTLFFLMVRVRYVGAVRLFFLMLRVRYVGAQFELKIPDFSHFAPHFCMQRQKTAEADAKCVN